MSIIGREIIQTRLYIDPNEISPPNLNYKEVFPITVFEGVRRNMEDENSTTLKEVLDDYNDRINSKQPIIPPMPANYLVTHGGIAGMTGSILITQNIPYEPENQSHNRIPTEKAVGDLLYKLGLIDSDGNGIPDTELKINWSSIIGRPTIYNLIGSTTDGVPSQLLFVNTVNDLTDKINTVKSENQNLITLNTNRINSHIHDYNNPHGVTTDQIGAVLQSDFDDHIINYNNPHRVNATHVGLENVDNTSDLDKPISIAMQNALTLIANKFVNIDNLLNEVIIGAEYNQQSGRLTFTLVDDTKIILNIPINGLVDDVYYDDSRYELLITDLSGERHHVDLSTLFLKYLGSVGSNITVEIDGNNITGEQIIKAKINENSISDKEMKNNSVITRTIKDRSVTSPKIDIKAVTTENLADKSVTYDKIEPLAVHTSRINDRAVTGTKLFSSTENDRLLGVIIAGSDPVWTRLTSGMINENAILTDHISDDQITTNKIVNSAVTSDKIADESVTTDKIKNFSVTNDKIANRTIRGVKIIESALFPGTPRIMDKPSADSYSDQIASTEWVKDVLRDYVFISSNFANRSVDGRILFSSIIWPRVLAVTSVNGDPEWTLITNPMLDKNIIETKNIVDRAVISSKIDDLSIKSNHISFHAVKTDHISEGAVTGMEIEPSAKGGRVLGVLSDGLHPEYTQVLRSMIQKGSIYGDHIENKSIPVNKIIASDVSNRILVTAIKNTDPFWGQATSEMVANRAIKGNNLFSSNFKNRVLVVKTVGDDPEWGILNGDMIGDYVIKSNHIEDKAIGPNHIKDKAIESNHILDSNIDSIHVKDRSIIGSKLFTSPYPDRVLAVIGDPYNDPVYTTVNTNMIDNEAITREKIFTSKYPYRVLGTTQAGIPPEYIRITADFIVDDSITPQKLQQNLVLFGTPELTVAPVSDANNLQLPNTRWVRETIAEAFDKYDKGILDDSVTTNAIKNRAVTGPKLFTSNKAPRVLGITAPNVDPEYLLVEGDLIADGGVTNNKLQRDLVLFGHPTLELRPHANTSDSFGGGSQIPDCQWVIDAIKLYAGTTSPGGGSSGESAIGPNTITSEMLMNRIVDGSKLFTTNTYNKVLAVLTPNTNPQYVKINNDMMNNRIIDGRTLFTSTASNVILGIKSANTDPEWTKIINDFMAPNSINTPQIRDIAVTTPKIADRAITWEKLTQGPIIETIHLFDNSVSNSKIINNSITTDKIVNNSVTTEKINNDAVTSDKIESDTILKGHPTVPAHTDYETRSIRNTIISPNAPTNDQGKNGDIWFHYI